LRPGSQKVLVSAFILNLALRECYAQFLLSCLCYNIWPEVVLLQEFALGDVG